ncbi:MAG: hypothetical protein ACRENQ_11505, partial [Gemmatimonadaceae bacterium]
GQNWFGLSGAEPVFDWPFLDQANRDHSLVALSPMVWYSDPGALTVGMRARSSYLSLVDQYDFGLAVTSGLRTTPGHPAPSAISRVQGWWRFQNPYWDLLGKPAIGTSAGVAVLDGVAKLDFSQHWDLSPFWTAVGPRIGATLGVTGAYPYDRGMLPAGWEDRSLTEVHGSMDFQLPRSALGDEGSMRLAVSAAAGLANPAQRVPGSGFVLTSGPAAAYSLGPVAEPAGYGRVEVEGTSVSTYADSASLLSLRLYGAVSNTPPAQRALHLSASDPLSNFADNWYRPQGSILTSSGVNYLPLGGAGLRGYDPSVTVNRIVAGNVEVSQRLARRVFSGLSVYGSAFGEAGFAASTTYQLNGSLLGDAGVGLSLRGKLYDRDVTMRLDLPLVVQQPGLAGGRGLVRPNGTVAARWVFSFDDLW